MEIDAFFTIGKDHKVCDDYTLYGLTPYPFVLLSDGCSSNQYTDIGSRILTSVAKKNLIHFHPTDYMNYLTKVLDESRDVLSLMDIDKTALNATLIMIIQFEDKIYALIIGDGCLIYQDKLFKNHYIKHEFSENLPFYLNYLNVNVKDFNLLTVEKNNQLTTEDFKSITLYEFPLSEINWVVGSTDGIFSFSNGSELIDFPIMFEKIVDFKSFKGEFIERKLKRITKVLNKEGYFNSDDWSLGGLYLGENNENIC